MITGALKSRELSPAGVRRDVTEGEIKSLRGTHLPLLKRVTYKAQAGMWWPLEAKTGPQMTAGRDMGPRSYYHKELSNLSEIHPQELQNGTQPSQHLDFDLVKLSKGPRGASLYSHF